MGGRGARTARRLDRNENTRREWVRADSGDVRSSRAWYPLVLVRRFAILVLGLVGANLLYGATAILGGAVFARADPWATRHALPVGLPFVLALAPVVLVYFTVLKRAERILGALARAFGEDRFPAFGALVLGFVLACFGVLYGAETLGWGREVVDVRSAAEIAARSEGYVTFRFPDARVLDAPSGITERPAYDVNGRRSGTRTWWVHPLVGPDDPVDGTAFPVWLVTSPTSKHLHDLGRDDPSPFFDVSFHDPEAREAIPREHASGALVVRRVASPGERRAFGDRAFLVALGILNGLPLVGFAVGARARRSPSR